MGFQLISKKKIKPSLQQWSMKISGGDIVREGSSYTVVEKGRHLWKGSLSVMHSRIRTEGIEVADHSGEFRGETVLSEFRESVSWRMVMARWALTFNHAYISTARESMTSAMLDSIFDWL